MLCCRSATQKGLKMARQSPKIRHDVHALCARAAAALKSAGFERAAVSMKSEAVYFRLPGRHGLLRVSTHKSKKSPIGLGNVVARLTFRGNAFDAHSILVCSDEKIDTMIWIAVGQYIMNSASEQPSAYQGKRGTWENQTPDWSDPRLTGCAVVDWSKIKTYTIGGA